MPDHILHPQEMVWTTEPPTGPGYFFAKGCDGTVAAGYLAYDHGLEAWKFGGQGRDGSLFGRTEIGSIIQWCRIPEPGEGE